MDNFLRQTSAEEATVPGSASERQPPVLSGYRTGRLLGIGGSARVWLVEDQASGVTAALKVFPEVHSGSDAGVEGGRIAQLQREVTVLGGLRHPHLLGLRGVVSTDQGPGLLMELAGGGSLVDVVAARGRLSVGESVTVLGPIAQALAYLHSHSVRHGDVSPGNVLFTSEGKPLLADLGVGRLLGEAGENIHGTPGFADAARGSATHGFTSDVYSLAAIGWYALTGNAPGPERERVPLTVLVPEVPVELLYILEAGLREDPAQRPSASETAESVLRAAEAQPLDLVNAVHPSVRPELLTRRVQGSLEHRPRRWFSGVFPRLNRAGGPRRTDPWPTETAIRRDATRRPFSDRATARPKRRRAGRRRAYGATKRRISPMTSVPAAVAALLVLSGIVLLGPQAAGTPRNAGESSAGRGPEVQQRADNAASAETQGAGSAPGESTTRGDDAQLSPKMRSRLSDADPVRALSALVAVRAMVLAGGDTQLLSHVNIEDSAAMAADRDLVAGLEKRGHAFHGLSIRLREAAPTKSLAVGEGRAAVAATAIMSSYTEMDSSGRTVRTVGESTPQDLVFVLEKHENRWKIAGVHNGSTV